MKSQDILDAMQDIREEWIEAAAPIGEKQPRRLMKYWIPAACIGAACAAAILLFFWLPGSRDLPRSKMPTSEKYSTLDDLLAAMSAGEEHNTLGSGFSLSPVSSDDTVPGVDALVYQGYSYHGAKGNLYITKLDGENTVTVNTLEGIDGRLYLTGNRLVVHSDFTEDYEAYYQKVKIFSLENPEQPELLESYTQLGKFCGSYMVGNTLYLLSSDGVCACGYSRLSDRSAYVPELSHNGEDIYWGDEDICILGNPTSVKYIAATMIRVDTGEIVDKMACYGNIWDLYCGAGDLVFQTMDGREQEMLYVFSAEDSIYYAGNIDLAQALGIDRVKAYTKLGTNESKRISDIYQVRSAYRDGSVIRVLANYTKIVDMEKWLNAESSALYPNEFGIEVYVMVAAADMATGVCKYTLTETGSYYPGILWEKDRVILTVPVRSEENFLSDEERFIFAEFSGTNIKTYESDLLAGNVSFVNIRSENTWIMEKLGKGRYLRFNEDDPNGFDIFDFANSRRPRYVYESEGETDGDMGPEFQIYDENTFAVKVTRGEYPNRVYFLQIYSIGKDMDAPFTLLAEYEIDWTDKAEYDNDWKESGKEGTIPSFWTVEYNGVRYSVSQRFSTVRPVTW